MKDQPLSTLHSRSRSHQTKTPRSNPKLPLLLKKLEKHSAQSSSKRNIWEWSSISTLTLSKAQVTIFYHFMPRWSTYCATQWSSTEFKSSRFSLAAGWASLTRKNWLFFQTILKQCKPKNNSLQLSRWSWALNT